MPDVLIRASWNSQLALKLGAGTAFLGRSQTPAKLEALTKASWTETFLRGLKPRDSLLGLGALKRKSLLNAASAPPGGENALHHSEWKAEHHVRAGFLAQCRHLQTDEF